MIPGIQYSLFDTGIHAPALEPIKNNFKYSSAQGDSPRFPATWIRRSDQPPSEALDVDLVVERRWRQRVAGHLPSAIHRIKNPVHRSW